MPPANDPRPAPFGVDDLDLDNLTIGDERLELVEGDRAQAEATVAANHALAPGVYRGAAAIVRDGVGLRIDPEPAATAEVIGWVTRRRALDPATSLRAAIDRRRLGRPQLWGIVSRLVGFHRDQPVPAAARSLPSGDSLLAGLEHRLDRDLLTRLQAAHDTTADRVAPWLPTRPARAIHGALRLDHVHQPPGGSRLLLVGRGCQVGDPAIDVAELVIDLQAHGQWTLARAFAEDFFAAAEDPDGARLLGYYASLSALRRAREQPERAEAFARLALGALSPARERPCMVLLAGLPGSGKSVLARGLRETANFTWVRADEVRKRLAGINPFAPATASMPAGHALDLLSDAWTDKTYAACLDRASDVCLTGGRTIVDAAFVTAEARARFVAKATEWGVPVHMLVATAPPELIRERLEGRGADPSEADWTIYLEARERWAPIDAMLCRTNRIDASGSPRDMLNEASRALARAGLV